MEQFCDIIILFYTDSTGAILGERESYCSNCHMPLGKRIKACHFIAEDPKDDSTIFTPKTCPFCGYTFGQLLRRFLNTETWRIEHD